MEKGKTTHSPLFLLKWVDSQKRSAFSAVAGKKVLNTAAARNHLRRKIYESIRALDIKPMTGVHAIIFAKNPAVTADQTALSTDLKSIFVKADLLR
jgi:ribonuclease P protein component